MVKINAMKSILGLFLALLMVPAVLAVGANVGQVVAGGHLIITDIDVKVGSKSDKNLKNSDSINEEAVPGDSVEFTIEVANNFTNSDDVEIQDIQVKVTIEGIDDDDDLEEEANEFDLDADDEKKVKVSFGLPLEVDEDNFDVVIEVEGDTDKNGTHEVKATLDFEVQKEDNEVRFTRNSVTPSEIKCSRTVQLSTGVINTGGTEEDDVALEVVNADLGMNFRETFDLTDDPFDDDSKFQKTFSYSVPVDTAPGIYPITTRVTFDDGGKTESETADLAVGVCEATAVQDEKEDASSEKDGEESSEVVVVQPTQPAVTQPGTAQTVTQPILSAKTQTSMFGSRSFLSTLVVAEIALVIVAVIIVFAVMRRKA